MNQRRWMIVGLLLGAAVLLLPIGYIAIDALTVHAVTEYWKFQGWV